MRDRTERPDRARPRRRGDRAFRPHLDALEQRLALSHSVAADPIRGHSPPAAVRAEVARAAPPRAAPRLLSVTYGGAGFHAISSDPDPQTGLSVVYDARQWLGGGPGGSAARRTPVLYAGGSTLTVSASWGVNLRGLRRGPILARGFATGGLVVGPARAFRAGGRVVVAAARARAPFAAVPGYDPDFTVRWQLSFNGGRTWVGAGASDNPLYVSAGNPIPDPNSGRLFLTVVDNAVRRSAGVAGQAAEVNAIWGAFVPLDLTRADGAPLRYYATPDGRNNVTVAKLLRDGDGQCSTWAKLFLDMLLVDGIRERGDYVLVSPKASADFLVKSYRFTPGVPSGVEGYPYMNVAPQEVVDAAGRRYAFGGLDEVTRPATAPDMLPGQNNPNPAASVFWNHQVVRLDGTLYDPSYGVTAPDLADYAGRAVAGYAKPATLWVNAAALGITLKPGAGGPDVRVRATVYATAAAGVDSLAVNTKYGPYDYGFAPDPYD